MTGITLAAGDASVEIAPATGSAIASFRWREQHVLRPADDGTRASGNVRGFACYPLVPWSNRIANATLALSDGSRFALTRNFGDHPHAIHGVGWQRAWNVVRASRVHALLAFDHRAGIDWPFAFHAEQAVGIHATAHAAVLTCTLAIRNDDSRASPYGLGWHPFFPRDTETILGFWCSLRLGDRGHVPADPQRRPAARLAVRSAARDWRGDAR